MNEYAMYKGDKLLYIGTSEELAKNHGVKRDTIYHFATPSYRKRRKNPENALTVIRLDGGDE